MAPTLSSLTGTATIHNWRNIRCLAADILAAQGWGTTGDNPRERFGLAGSIRDIGTASDYGHAVDEEFCAHTVNDRIADAAATTGDQPKGDGF